MHSMALSLKKALLDGDEVFVLSKDKSPEDIVKRLLNLGVKAIAEPVLTPIRGSIQAWEGFNPPPEERQIGFKLKIK